MNIQRTILSLVVAGSFLCPLGVSSQILTQTGPHGAVGWSVSAPLCTVLPNSAAYAVNYSAPSSVTFAPSAYGTIGLICPVYGMSNQLNLYDINALAFKFSNDNGSFGCSASIQVVDRTLATPILSWSSKALSYYGIWTVDTGIFGFTGFQREHTYDVEMYLTRTPYAVGHCNPNAYEAFLEDLYGLN